VEANKLRRRTEGADTTAREIGRLSPANPSPLASQAEPAADDKARLDAAVTALERRYPALSARVGLTTPQRLTLTTALLLASSCALFFPGVAITALQAILAAAFACLLLVRLIAIAEVLAPAKPPTGEPLRTANADLPVYTVLAALYHEADVVPQLIEALIALDYPEARLDIILALEADDAATLSALVTARLPGHMRIVVTPGGSPRTKPRALCYALTFARGDYVVVFDAEDQPEPGQLRDAHRAFAMGGPRLGCVQARLNVYNRHESWLTKQFALEYTALFDAILPSYTRLGVPVPLGGTSNHFPHAVLDHVGAWDPYNVTEDADIGVRLARFGYAVAILQSTTWEEAPPRARDWFAQAHAGKRAGCKRISST